MSATGLGAPAGSELAQRLEGDRRAVPPANARGGLERREVGLARG